MGATKVCIHLLQQLFVTNLYYFLGIPSPPLQSWKAEHQKVVEQNGEAEELPELQSRPRHVKICEAAKILNRARDKMSTRQLREKAEALTVTKRVAMRSENARILPETALMMTVKTLKKKIPKVATRVTKIPPLPPSRARMTKTIFSFCLRTKRRKNTFLLHHCLML